MRLALIGNSHLACLKLAWRDGEHQAEFLGANAGKGGLLAAWRRIDDPPALTLADTASDYHRHLWRLCRGEDALFRLDSFDAVVIVGVLRGACPWHLSHCAVGADVSALSRRGIAPCSFAQWRAMYGSTYRIDALRQLVERVRTGDAPVLALPRPLPRADASRYDPSYAPPERWTALPPTLKAALVTNERALVSRLGAEIGVRVVHPPRSTLVDGHDCDPRYSRGSLGSRNFASDKPQYGDTPADHALNISHKNRAYGALLAAQIGRALAGRPTEDLVEPTGDEQGHHDAP